MENRGCCVEAIEQYVGKSITQLGERVPASDPAVSSSLASLRVVATDSEFEPGPKLSSESPAASEPKRGQHRQPQTWSDWFSAVSIAIAGSWWYVLFELAVISAWIVINSVGNAQNQFDPAPFTFLNLGISFLQEYIGTFEVIAQNATYAAEQIQAAHHKMVIAATQKLAHLRKDASQGQSVAEAIEEAEREAKCILTQVEYQQELQALQEETASRVGFGGSVTFSDHVTDFLAKHVRSWKYIGCLTLFFTAWMVGNSEDPHSFDPFPYTYLNFFVSVWTLLQESFVIKVTFRRAQHDLKRNRMLFRQSIQILVLFTQFHRDPSH